LIEESAFAQWNPQDYHDSYRQDLMKRIQDKIRSKQTHTLTPKEKAPKEERKSADIIDLMSVLKKSLEERGGRATPRKRKVGRRPGLNPGS